MGVPNTLPKTSPHRTATMFKKELQPSPKQKLKSSVQRSLRSALLETYPLLTPYIDEVLPKKGSLESMKLPDRNTLFVLDGVPLFYQQGGNSGAVIPHLRLVHRFPQAFPTIRIDREPSDSCYLVRRSWRQG